MSQKRESDRRVLPVESKNGLLTVWNSRWADLLDAAKENSIGRARICAHQSPDSKIQEMLIAFMRDSYVRPHRHLNKSESFHVHAGDLSVIFFDEEGRETERVPLSADNPEKAFFFRSERNDWHTVLVESKYALVHEITSGPYDDVAKDFAPWAPEEGDQIAIEQFLQTLKRD